MKITNLQSILNLTAAQLASDNQLDIAATAFGLPAGPVYGSDPIQISGAGIATGSTSTKKVIQGTANLPQLQAGGTTQAVNVWLQVTRKALRQYSGRLIYQLPDDWNFKSSFPALPPDYDVSKDDGTPQVSALERLTMDGAFLVFSTDGENNYRFPPVTGAKYTFSLGPGLNYVSRWAPSGMMGVLESLIAPGGKLAIQGFFILADTASVREELPIGVYPWDQQPDPAPGIYLYAGLGLDVGIGTIVEFRQTRFHLYSPLSDDWWQANPSYAPEMAFAGNLNIPSAGISPAISARKMLGVDEELMIKGAFQGDGLTLAKMADLAGLNSGDQTLAGLLPDPVQQKIGSIGLKYIAVALAKNQSTYRIAYTFFVFEMPDIDWAVFAGIPGLENLLVINEIDTEIIVFNPFDAAGRNFAGNLTGKATILGASVDVVVGLPDFFITAELSEAQSIPIQQFFDEHIPYLPAPSSLAIDDFQVRAEPGNFYSFSLSLSGDWTIPIGTTSVGIDQIGLALMKVVGEDKPSGTFTGGITFFAGTDKEMNLSILLSMPASNDQGYECSASMDVDSGVTVGAMMQDLATELGFNFQLPDSIAGLTLLHLAISFNTQSKDFSFNCEFKFPIEDQEVDIILTIDLRHQPDNTYTQQFSGIFKLSGLEFDLALERQSGGAGTSSLLVADFYSEEGVEIAVNDLIGSYMPAGIDIPESLSFTLHDAVLAVEKTSSSGAGGGAADEGTKLLFVLDMGAGFNLSELPLVGSKLGSHEVKLAYRVLIASAGFDSDSLTKINALLPSGVGALPTTGDGDANPVPSGLGLVASLQMDGQAMELALPVDYKTDSDEPTATGAAPVKSDSSAADDGVKWVKIQKAIGPITFARVGVQYKEQVLWFMLDASLSVGGFTLSLDGLGAGSPFDRFEPQFRLYGLGIDYQNGPVEIGGALIRNLNPPDGVEFDFEGAAIIRTSALSLEALGAYAQLTGGGASMALYAALNYPLGGPSFFFVTGLAAGFGYNRQLVVPPIADLETYPMLAAALGRPEMTPLQLAENLKDVIPIQIGQYFLALGLKFTSFKLIDAFALLIVNIGQHFEIDLIGNCATQVPSKEAAGDTPPLAVVDMNFKATFIPDEGSLSLDAQLTSRSHILSEQCVLQGGFAFYCWFLGPHQGDFVTTLGGYHPDFQAPAHYPQVPRLGFNWQIDEALSLKGGLYFALIPHTLMAGGFLSANYRSRHLEAHFNAGADFLISWQPYHYDAKIYVDIGGAYHIKESDTGKGISIDLSAEVHVWGPPFSGTAKIDLTVVSVTVKFGAEDNLPPAPISWDAFKTAFLPPDEQIATITVLHGLLKNVEEGGETIWVVNPKEFSLLTNAVTPAKTAQHGTFVENHYEFGIESMGLNRSGVNDAKQTVTIVKGGTNVETDFLFTPVLKDMPAGLWGEASAPGRPVLPGVNDTSFVSGLFAGFEIKPALPPTPGETHSVDMAKLQYHLDEKANAFSLPATPDVPVFSENPTTGELDALIASDTGKSERTDLLQSLAALGLTGPVDQLAFNLAEDFVVSPQLVVTA